MDGENQDAWSVRIAPDAKSLYGAVSDGASGALFSGLWAQQLASMVTAKGFDPSRLKDEVGVARTSFDPFRGKEPPDPWVEEKWELYGSQATLITADARLTEDGSINIRSAAIGDSTLIVIEAAKFSTFPILRSADFGATPNLITTRDCDNVQANFAELRAGPDAVIVLASDGAAKPLIELLESGPPHAALDCLVEACKASTHSSFANADPLGIAVEDDATLIIVAAIHKASASESSGILRRLFELRSRL